MMGEKEEVCKQKVIRRTNYFNMGFAVLITLLVSAYIGAITFLAIPKPNIRFADTSLGFILGSVVTPLIIWAFRSSKAQQDKESAEMELKQLNGKGGANETAMER